MGLYDDGRIPPGGGGIPLPGMDPNEYKTDYSDMADAGVPNLLIMARGQAEQNKMQSAMMQLMGARMQQMQQGKLATNLEISSMKVNANMQEEQWRHDERLLELLQQHTEGLVDDGLIDKDTLGATSNYRGPDLPEPTPESSDNED